MKTSSTRSRTELARVLSARGESFADLATKCGLNIRTLYNLANGGNKTQSGRAKVERVLGIKIWPKSAKEQAIAIKHACPSPAREVTAATS